MRLDYQGESGELGHMELVRIEGRPPRYYARTEATVSWVSVRGG